jgi:hypothetical protein
MYRRERTPKTPRNEIIPSINTNADASTPMHACMRAHMHLIISNARNRTFMALPVTNAILSCRKAEEDEAASFLPLLLPCENVDEELRAGVADRACIIEVVLQ